MRFDKRKRYERVGRLVCEAIPLGAEVLVRVDARELAGLVASKDRLADVRHALTSSLTRARVKSAATKSARDLLVSIGKGGAGSLDDVLALIDIALE